MERALAGMVAGEKEGPALGIPAGEGEAADQMIQDADVPARPRGGKDLIIGCRQRKIQLAGQVAVIIDAQVGYESRHSRR